MSFALAQAPVPVVAALGGGGESTAVDEVAHVSLPDGDAAARWLLDRLAEAWHTLADLAEEVDVLAAQAARRARDQLSAAKDEVAGAGVTAAARAATSRHRVRIRLLVLAALIAVALVAAAVVTGRPIVLAGLAVLAVILLGAYAWSARAMRRGSGPMSAQDDEFVTVLTRLREVRDQLAATSSPETVHRLRDGAAQLVAHGERILARHSPVTPLTPDDRAAAGA